MPSPDVRTLTVLRDLRRSIADEAAGRLDRWQGEVETPSFAASAANLAQYLAFRHHDLRPLQRELTQHGLSSLGRLESRVMVTLDTAEACLSAAPTGQRAKNWPPAAEEFFRGEMQLLANTQALLGGAEEHAVGRILVTLPTDAAVEREYLLEIARRGADLVRINCAHDQPATWAAMIESASQATC